MRKKMSLSARRELLSSLKPEYRRASAEDRKRLLDGFVTATGYNRRSTIIASQLPLDKWHAAIGEPTIADAILDRLVHNAYKITIKTKESMRKPKN